MNAALFAAMLLLAAVTGLNARRWFLMSVVAITLALGGCYKITGYPQIAKTTERGRVVLSTISVVWQPDVEHVAAACGRENGLEYGITYACAIVELANDGFTSTCTIYATQPTDFNDEPVLAVLGHEAYHCFGARHS